MKKAISLTFLILSFSCNDDKRAPTITETPHHDASSYHWKGTWERENWQNDATLEIKNVIGDSILEFELHASSGGNMGDLEGKASLRENNAAYYSPEGPDDCALTFELSDDKYVKVTQEKGICGAGMGVAYDGNYYNPAYKDSSTKHKETLFSLGIFENSNDDSIFRQLTKADYDLFLESTQLTTEEYDEDSLYAKVHSSGVRGLFTFMENIIMIDQSKNIWAAVIDDEKVLYYTNSKEYAHRLPITIENWRSRFKEYKVIFKTLTAESSK